MMELLNYCSDEQVSLACKMVDAVVPSDHELQGVLLNHMCDKAEMNMVLGRLQKQPQVLAPDNESLQRFVQRLATAEGEDFAQIFVLFDLLVTPVFSTYTHPRRLHC